MGIRQGLIPFHPVVRPGRTQAFFGVARRRAELRAARVPAAAGPIRRAGPTSIVRRPQSRARLPGVAPAESVRHHPRPWSWATTFRGGIENLRYFILRGIA